MPSKRNVADLTESEIQFIRKTLALIPLHVLAQRLSLELLDLSAWLREKGISEYARPEELVYIRDNIDRIPAEEIRTQLRMSETQFALVVNRTLGLTTQTARSDMNMEIAIGKTRWLVETKLGLPIDDFLPRSISNTHFSKNDLFGCVDFATREKAKHTEYRSFPAVAFLICNSYPGIFRLFQFRHSKLGHPFRGRDGKRNILDAVKWVLETKFGYDLSSLGDISKNKHFLRSSDLQFYGIGYHWYRPYFKTREELVKEVVRISDKTPKKHSENTMALRQKVQGEDVDPRKCFATRCSAEPKMIEIHHIFPRARAKAEFGERFDFDIQENLIPLCANHHKKVADFNFQNLLRVDRKKWRSHVRVFLGGGVIQDAEG
ncbi:MAG: hypothetical protein HYY84_12550 [Deltaproteobacteria bacterium]|nr:hypothetical protein [Deltaproteobacteria bacterium]